DTPDGNPENNTANDAVRFVGAADLGVDITDTPDPVVAGTNLAYRITVSNAGPSTAPNVLAQDVLPEQVSVVSFTPSQGSCNGGVPGDALQPLTCKLGSLAPGGSATIDVVVKVNPTTPDGTLSGDTLTRNLGDRPAGAAKTFNINITVQGARGEVTNRASVGSATVDPDATNNAASRTVIVQGGE